MAPGNRSVAETRDGISLGQFESLGDGRSGATAHTAGVDKRVLLILARLLARQTAAEAVEQHEHESTLDGRAPPDGS
jgi:hypothetical protein